MHVLTSFRTSAARLRSSGALLALASLIVLALSPGSAKSAPPLPLGKVTLESGGDSTCPAGFKCQRFSVTCPQVAQDASGVLAKAPAAGAARGMVLFFNGDEGTTWWAGTPQADSLLSDLRRHHLAVVQVRWVDSWLVAPPGSEVGPGVLACRPSSIIAWVHDHLYKPTAKHHARTCGFCATGNSGGASEISYALSFYGLDTMLDVVVPTSGPPHAAILKGCDPAKGSKAYRYSPTAANLIDDSYGFAAGTGPCTAHSTDSAWATMWHDGAVDTGGNDFFHPRTRIVFILGGQDAGVAPPHAMDYLKKLRRAKSPAVYLRRPSAMPHAVQASDRGLYYLGLALERT